MPRARKLKPEEVRGAYVSHLLGRSQKSLAASYGVAQATMARLLHQFEYEHPEEAREEREMLGMLDDAWTTDYGACPAKPERIRVCLCGGEIAERWQCGACGRVLRAGQPRACGACGTIVRWPR